MIITTLVENTRPTNRKDLTAEKGLSLHIRHGDQSILFDTGVKDAVCSNARTLNIDLSSVDLVIISHHHFDHGGGLPHFLRENSKAPIYLRSRRDEKYYFRTLVGFNKYVGLDDRMFDEYADRFEYVDQFSEIFPGIFILTRIGDSFPRPKGNRMLYCKKDHTWNLDTFDHELILAIKESDWLAVFTGCSHHGILNMVEAVNKQFPGIPIKAVFGGFHQILLPQFDLMSSKKQEVEELGQSILEFPVEKAYTGHCTGQRAYRVLERVMGDRLACITTGSVIEI